MDKPQALAGVRWCTDCCQVLFLSCTSQVCCIKPRLKVASGPIVFIKPKLAHHGKVPFGEVGLLARVMRLFHRHNVEAPSSVLWMAI